MRHNRLFQLLNKCEHRPRFSTVQQGQRILIPTLYIYKTYAHLNKSLVSRDLLQQWKRRQGSLQRSNQSTIDIFGYERNSG